MTQHASRLTNVLTISVTTIAGPPQRDEEELSSSEEEEEGEDELEEGEEEGRKEGEQDTASDSEDSLGDFSSPPKRPLGSEGEGSQGQRGEGSPKRLLEEDGEVEGGGSPLFTPPSKVQSPDLVIPGVKMILPELNGVGPVSNLISCSTWPVEGSSNLI